MKVFAIETSCDETAAAVVENGRKIISSTVATQIQEHCLYGGVVPEIASRRHCESISQVGKICLKKANLDFSEIDAVAVTFAPGLIGSLLVGVSYAKGLSFALKKPLIAVHHLRSHIASAYLSNQNLKPPFLALIISGGHSHIVYVKDYCRFKVVGRTRDDAAGEAFDKVARALGYPYPGGVQVDLAAKSGNKNAYEPFVSNANYGHLITSIIPIKVDEVNVAFVFAEVLVEDYEKDVSSFILWTIFVSLIIVVALVLIAVAVISRRFVKPILSISAEVRKFVSDNTKVSEELKNIKTGDEIELLAKSVLQMEIDTEKYIENLVNVTAEEERIKSELGVATHIQADMLPSIFPPFPNRNEFSLTASMSPAKEVGGDFYDFFFVDNNHLGLVMADVSGKGVPAALFMVIAKTLIKDKAILDGSEGNYSTAEVLKYVNEQLCNNNREGFFVTVWFAIFDLATGEGIESNAGHEYPAICRNGEKYELIKSKHSPAVATMEWTNFRENGFKLNPGDSLYVYTDGVTEATNSEGELFGEKGLIESLNRDTSASTTETLAIVRKDVDKFVDGAPQFDDITMLCFKYYGKGGPRIERDNLEGSS